MAVKTYDPKKVKIALGSHSVTGLSDTTFLSIEYHGEGVTFKVGCDTEELRTVDHDHAATITLTVLMQSPTIAWAQKQYDMDMETCDGDFPVLIKDLRGGLVFSAQNAWIRVPPGREFSNESSDREIIIDCGASTWEGELEE